MERFIEETFGAKPLFQAYQLTLDALEQVDELHTPRAAPAALRKIRTLLTRIEDAAQLHHWVDELDLIASLQFRRTSRTELQQKLRAGLQDLERRLHDRLLGAVVTRLEGRRRQP
ncbi:MAG TPA: hypothetical protein VFP39_07520 [Gemmatimonadales bacterium]|nr:hypothetical protein [Gemmatimonadales bacterium]